MPACAVHAATVLLRVPAAVRRSMREIRGTSRSSRSFLPQSKRPSSRRAGMAWKAPKIVEVSVGMEINMYACAARK
jgi:coenzyme PQQ precursor peptide PqqA